MADQIDIMKMVIRRVIKEEPELILDIIKKSLTVEVHHEFTYSATVGPQITTEIVLELNEHKIHSSKDTVIIK